MPRPRGVKKDDPVIAPEKRAKNTPITKVLEQVSKCPALTTRELGKLNDISHVAVVNLFKRHGIERERIEEYKGNRADFLAGLQEKIVSAITEEDLQKASLRDKVISAGVLFDKERLERGQSTGNISLLHRIIEESPDLPD